MPHTEQFFAGGGGRSSPEEGALLSQADHDELMLATLPAAGGTWRSLGCMQSIYYKNTWGLDKNCL